MKILVLGSGGREHALAWKLAQSPGVSVYGAPGNPGFAKIGPCIPVRNGEPESYLAAAESIGADLTVVGPEAPLVAGVVDAFRARGKRIVGPDQRAAQLEGSKIFAKNFFVQSGIPTAAFVTVSDETDARKALDRFGFPMVLKADGLAAGKGVVIANDRASAETALQNLKGPLVIEEFLEGKEVSFIALCDGRDVLPLAPTQDHKAAFDGDTGPNTGGMGAYLSLIHIFDDGGAIFSGPMADFFRAEVEVGVEAAERVGGFDRVQVLTLDILDEGDFEEAVIRDVADDGWHLFETG